MQENRGVLNCVLRLSGRQVCRETVLSGDSSVGTPGNKVGKFFESWFAEGRVKAVLRYPHLIKKPPTGKVGGFTRKIVPISCTLLSKILTPFLAFLP